MLGHGTNTTLVLNLPAAMSFNATLHGWSDYAAQAQSYLPSTPRLALLGLVNLPLIIIAFNVLYQLVRVFFSCIRVFWAWH